MSDQSQVYTLDDALTSMEFGRFQGLALAYSGLGWFAEAMEVMILSFVGSAVKSEWQLSSSEESIITTVVFAGMLVGSYSWGLISDNYGRRMSILGGSIVTSVAGLLSAFSPNYVSLVILRGMAGAGLGCGHVFFSWFLEFVPPSNRGMWMIVFSTFWTFGSVSEAGLAWIVMPRLNWRWLLALSAIPSFILLIFISLMPESPRYLCMKGRLTDAHNILEKIALVNGTSLPSGNLISDGRTKLDEEFATSEETPLLTSTRNKSTVLKSGLSSFLMLFSTKLFRTTILLWILFFGNSFVYYGIVLLTSALSSTQSKCGSPFLHSENVQDASLYVDVFINSFAEFPGLLLAAIIVDREGRKSSMTIMFTLVCIFLLPLATHQSNIVTTTLLFAARMCSMGTFTIACTFGPEIYPTSMRSTGAGVANAMGKIGGMICPLVAVGLVTNCHQTAAIILLVVIIVVSVVSILLIPFETKGKELSDTIDGITNSKLVVRKHSPGINQVLVCIFLLPLVTHQSNFLTAAILSGARMCSMGTFTIAYAFASEIYLTSMRSAGAGVANAMGKIGGMICPLVAGGLVTSCHQRAAIILLVVVIVLSVVSILLIPFGTERKELIDKIDGLKSNSKLVLVDH